MCVWPGLAAAWLAGVRLGAARAGPGAVLLLLGLRADAGAGRHAGQPLRARALRVRRRDGLRAADLRHAPGGGLGRLATRVRAAHARGAVPGGHLPLRALHAGPLVHARRARPRLCPGKSAASKG